MSRKSEYTAFVIAGDTVGTPEEIYTTEGVEGRIHVITVERCF